jgi:protein-S-isoprenylcysteine O-methyltransferase Ste14
MTAIRLFGWFGLALAMVLIEAAWGSRKAPQATEAARLSNQLMMTATVVALLGGMLGPLVFPGWTIDPRWAAPAGLTVGVGGLVLRVAAMRTLGNQYTLTPVVGEGHRLITGGPYRFVRHPGYSAILLQLLGLALLSASVVSIASLLPVVALLPLRIRVEERLLADHFGAEYREYVRRTPYRLVMGVV